MLNKKDPLIGAVQDVMQRNHLEREVTRVVNEAFGIEDRKALPHEYQAEWDSVYQQVMTEAVEGSIPKTPREKDLASKHGHKGRITKGDVLKARGVLEEDELEEQELSSGQAYQMGRGVQKLATKPFGRPGFNMAGRSAATGTAQGNVPGIGQGKITANRVDAPGGYNQATVTATRPSGSPIGTARMDASGARMTSIAGRRVNEQMKDPNARDVTSPSSMGIKKPNYATGTPDYVKPKTQTVNSAEKTSLPAGTLAKTMKEEEQLDEKSPPGRKDQVMALKKKFPKKSAFAIAWSSYNKSKKKNLEEVNLTDGKGTLPVKPNMLSPIGKGTLPVKPNMLSPIGKGTLPVKPNMLSPIGKGTLPVKPNMLSPIGKGTLPVKPNMLSPIGKGMK